MKKIVSTILAVCCLSAAFCFPALAAEYSFDGADVGQFAEPTSDYTVYVGTQEEINIDRSKTAALIPPSFGSPTSFTLNSGMPLTPNLVNQGNSTVTAASNNAGGVTVLPPTSVTVTGAPSAVSNVSGALSSFGFTATSYTDVTAGLYYSSGELGSLSIPAVNLSVKVFQGTDNSTLAKGAGHFTDTSIWDGNVAIAAHNRGVNNHFGQIHTLNIGDRVSYTTKLGTRTYAVTSVSKIAVDDGSILTESADNTLTLVTCVMNQPEYRWCVIAKETA